ncbi:MAG: PAS domain-containing protein [Betaproteobacteria bacterium]|nr:PAS domain-containing protein [Betaproteobacteria bacterium]
MTESVPPLDPRELEAAFSLFNQASTQLASAYADLQARVDRLAGELAVANGELKRQFLEKEALSERLRLLLDALPGGVVVLDGEGRVIEANPAARAWLGDELAGQRWAAVASARLVATPGAQEWTLVAPKGARRLTVSESPLDASGGRILLLNDVTDAVKLRHQLEHHKRLSAMGEMAAGLAHQLRTPLATALLHTANLARSDLSEADRQRFSERVRERLRHLERMIQDMLQFVRGQPAADEAVDVAEVLADVSQTIEPQMQARGVSFRVLGDAAARQVRGDRKALAGALLNLLENAMQATPEGGTVTLSAETVKQEIRIHVIDTGRGMEPEVRRRVFEPFFTTRQEGTGLGLAIVRSVANAHGGDADVESDPGQGSDFVIRLPLLGPVPEEVQP